MFKTLTLASAVSLALSSLFSAQSSASTALADASDIERITVRGAYFGQQNADAVKTPTLLINVPNSLSVISAEQIIEQGFESIDDIVQFTPGISMGQGEGHRDQLTIRGQNTTADFFIDGLRDDVQYFRPLYNLERVEVLRGANALLFGRGGGGGIVNRVTKTANFKTDFTNLNANIDTFSNTLLAVDHNLAISDDQAFRVNGFFESIDNHRDQYEGERYAVNPTFTHNFSDATQILVSYEYINDDRAVDRGVPSLNGEPLRGVSRTFFGDAEANFTTLEAHIAKIKVDHQLSENWTLNSTLQYADYDKLYQNLYPAAFDGTSNNVTLDGYKDATVRTNLILQFNAIGQIETGNIEHTLLIGAEYGDQETGNNRRDTLFTQSQDDQISFLFSDPLNIPAFEFTDFVRDRNSNVRFLSVFFQDEIKLSDSFILVAGMRLDSFDIDVIDAIERADGSADGNNGFLSRKDNKTSPRLGFIYKPFEDMSIYASMSKSFLPRSGDQFLTLSPSSAALDPEEFENREIGIKYNLSDSLSLTAAIFEILRENGTAVDPNNPEDSITTGTDTNGFEMQLVGQLTDGWEITAGYSRLNGRETGRVVDGDLANRVLSQVPDHMFSMWNSFDLTDKWDIALGLVYQAEQFTSLSNRVELPSILRIDAGIYYELSEQTKVQLNIENVLDEEYFPSAHNDNNITIGRPFNARLGVTYKF